MSVATMKPRGTDLIGALSVRKSSRSKVAPGRNSQHPVSDSSFRPRSRVSVSSPVLPFSAPPAPRARFPTSSRPFLLRPRSPGRSLPTTRNVYGLVRLSPISHQLFFSPVETTCAVLRKRHRDRPTWSHCSLRSLLDERYRRELRLCRRRIFRGI